MTGVMRYHARRKLGVEVNGGTYGEVERIIKRDYGSLSLLAVQFRAMQAALERKDSEIAALMRRNVNLQASFAELETKILEALNEARLGLAIEMLLERENITS